MFLFVFFYYLGPPSKVLNCLFYLLLERKSMYLWLAKKLQKRMSRCYMRATLLITRTHRPEQRLFIGMHKWESGGRTPPQSQTHTLGLRSYRWPSQLLSSSWLFSNALTHSLSGWLDCSQTVGNLRCIDGLCLQTIGRNLVSQVYSTSLQYCQICHSRQISSNLLLRVCPLRTLFCPCMQHLSN